MNCYMFLFPFVLILCQRLAATSVVEIPVTPSMVALSDTLFVGTGKQEMAFQFSLTTSEISISDAECNNTYGKCGKYCNLPTFCSLYCSPMCCIMDTWVETRCDTLYNKYLHNSSKLKILNDYWKSADGQSLGVWAEDQIFFKDSARKTMDLGTLKMALNVYTSVLNAEWSISLARVGLARDSTSKNFVNALKERGYINYALFTTVFSNEKRRCALMFGDYKREDCKNELAEFKAAGDREWILDAVGVRFLDYESRRRYRLLFTEDISIYMPRHVLVSFINAGALTFKQSSMFAPSNTYAVNLTTFDINQRQFFALSNSFALNVTLRSINVAANTGDLQIHANALDPNPDNVEWAAGDVFFREYCVSFDYELNTVGFSELLEKRRL
ncbi:unnamed protein product [Bursaphelenchus xylophilus]|uniref:(pine wood nematode) hypothetical protein n=1 Tax=Bursaphelenchus xylophilus TaxID=6326 RepID=A0A1I7S2C3_BURXY|nr:unnamed protein product [Bursaphelenchus xylophilus]CAG9114683.1 unnamed protein product [Bursaphelenchus xylophilus]